MSEQGGGPSFRVNRRDVIAVLFNTATAVVGSVAGMFQAFAFLARGHSNYQDDRHDFQMKTALNIETIAGEHNGR